MGLTQRDLEKVGRMLADRHGIRVICAGNRCQTDGKTIYLPLLPDKLDNPGLVSMIRYFLDHECGHIIWKSSMKVGQKLLDAEGEDASMILDAVEDCRVEQIMADIWLGCGINLRLGLRELMQKWESSDLAEKDNPLRQFLTAIFMHAKGLPIPGWIKPEASDVVLAYSDRLQEMPLWAEKTSDLLPLVMDLLREYRRLNPPPEKEPSDAGGGNDGTGQEQTGEGGQGGSSAGGGGQTGGTSVSAQTNERAQAENAGDVGSGGAQEQSTPAVGGDGERDRDAGGSSSDNGEQQDGDSGGGNPADASERAGDSEEAGDGGDVPGMEPGSGSATQPDSGGTGASDTDGAVPQAPSGPASQPSPIGGTEAATPLEERLGNFDYSKARLDVAEELKDAIGRELGKLADSSMARRRPALPDQYRTLDFTGLCHSPDWTKAFADQSKKAGGPMRQRLSQLLMVEERCWWQGGKARGSPDPRTLAQLATRMGNRVLRSRVEHLKPDTACYLLVDGSASMGHEQRLTQAMLAAAAFSLTLDACGHANCVSIFENENMTGNFYSDMSRARMAGFNDEKAANLAGFTMECVTLRRVKKWSEPASRALEKMAAACGSSAGGTPLGQSILIASKDLLARPEKRKVLMCFTDGGPDDPVLASDACVEAERAGIQLVLIGILNDSVKHLHDRYAVVNDAAKLSGATFEELTKALHPGLGGRRRDRGRKVEA